MTRVKQVFQNDEEIDDILRVVQRVQDGALAFDAKYHDNDYDIDLKKYELVRLTNVNKFRLNENGDLIVDCSPV